MYTRGTRSRPLAITHSRLDLLHSRIAGALPNGVLIVDAHGQITFANAEIERQFGYDVQALTGQPVDILLPESSRAFASHRQAVLDDARAARHWLAHRTLPLRPLAVN